MKKPNSMMKLPVEILDTLHTEDLLLVVGGAGGDGYPNNSDGTCSGPNNGNGKCGGANNMGGTCSGVNNGNGKCGIDGGITLPPKEPLPQV